VAYRKLEQRAPAERRGGASVQPEALPDTITARIQAIGADGDGIARLPDGRPLYLPFTLPGENVEARKLYARGGGLGGEATVLDPGAERVTPPCPHFGTCGGCTLQHWQLDAIRLWKAGELVQALTRAGFTNATAEATLASAPGTRRRVDLAFRRGPAGEQLGFHAHRSRDIVPVAVCPVTEPAIVALLAPLRDLLPRLAAIHREAACIINLLDSGPDLLLRTDADLNPADRRLLAAFGAAQGIPRIAWARGTGETEMAAQLGPVRIILGGVEAAPPPGAFLQATATGASDIAAAVAAGLPADIRARDRVVELHAGSGTLTFALARKARVHAYEGDSAAALALEQAAGRAGLHGNILVHRRDLARQPLGVADFAGARAVVLDPPFGGAPEQIDAVARSSVGRIIYVSCNPAALSREVGLLRAAGFNLLQATPIDQFVWSSRLESVVVLDRKVSTDRRFRPPR
jgi:23S rRNA (uracil1939-C5)-methyltransferase